MVVGNPHAIFNKFTQNKAGDIFYIEERNNFYQKFLAKLQIIMLYVHYVGTHPRKGIDGNCPPEREFKLS